MTTRPEPLADRLHAARVLPVLKLDDAGRATAIADALVAGGVPTVEVTLRTEAGAEAIAALAGRTDITVGAGTVLTPEQVDRVADAGAEFVVSPGFDPDVVARTLQRGLLPVPGIATPSELQAALRAGLDLVKVFPVAVLGGPSMLGALAAPFPGVRFLPSGGITLQTAPDYLALPTVLAVGGSWMVPADAIAAGRFDEVERACRETADALGLPAGRPVQ